MKGILEKTRVINQLLQTSGGKTVDFRSIAYVLRDIINCNVYIIGRRGNLLGQACDYGFRCQEMGKILKRKDYPVNFDMNLLINPHTVTNINFSGSCLFRIENLECNFKYKVLSVVPILGGGERLGTLALAKNIGEFDDADMILAEYGATIVGMEILRERWEEAEEEARRKTAVHLALESLSYSEREVLDHIFRELEGNEGFLVAAQVADRAKITRSVIVNALRKLESAGVIESKSLGMKGTFIRVINESLLGELYKTKK